MQYSVHTFLQSNISYMLLWRVISHTLLDLNQFASLCHSATPRDEITVSSEQQTVHVIHTRQRRWPSTTSDLSHSFILLLDSFTTFSIHF